MPSFRAALGICEQFGLPDGEAWIQMNSLRAKAARSGRRLQKRVGSQESVQEFASVDSQRVELVGANEATGRTNGPHWFGAKYPPEFKRDVSRGTIPIPEAEARRRRRHQDGLTRGEPRCMAKGAGRSRHRSDSPLPRRRRTMTRPGRGRECVFRLATEPAPHRDFR